MSPEQLQRTTQIFFSLYFTMTGLHALHMIVGIGIIGVVAWMAYRGKFDSRYYARGNDRAVLALRRHRLDLSVPVALPGGAASVVMAHVATKTSYVTIFLTLMVFTAVTVAAAFMNLGAFNASVALGIAGFKATLVVLYFMHVKYSSRLTKLVVVSGLFFLAILLLLTMVDYAARGWVGAPAALQ